MLQSTVAQVPAVVGYMRPVILLPVTLVTSIPVAQLEAILAHELAHVRRHDFAVNLLQTLVETVFFYHPGIWWMSRRIRLEREHCCDDWVVQTLGNRVEYGRALLVVEELRGRSTVLALGADDGSLLSRVRRIAGIGSETIPVRWRDRLPAALLGIAIGAAVLAVSISWSMAAKEYVAVENASPAMDKQPEMKKMPTGKEYGPKDWACWFVNQVQYRKQKDGSFPAVSFKHLRKWVIDDLSSEPKAAGAADARAWLETTAADKKWAEAEFRSQVERIGNWRLSVIQRALPEEESASRCFPKPGRPATAEELRAVNFGPTAENGLRVAWVFDPAKKDYTIGELLNCRVVLYNSAAKPVQFVAQEPLDGVWTIRDAEGKPIKMEDVDRSGFWTVPQMAPFQRYRLAPGQHVELHGKGIGIGAADYSTAKIDVWQIIHARAGETLQTSVETTLGIVHREGELPFGGFADDEFPEEKTRDWAGSLRSGEVKFKVVAAPARPRSEEDAWGPESRGLRCRLVAVPASANDESPDLTKTASQFACGDHVTFAVELKNVSDKPQTLIGVRHDAKGQPRFEGKLAPEFFAPHLFEFSFSDANGKPLTRASRVFLEMPYLLHGALTHEIAPGESLVVLLRPARFHAPMDQCLPPGSYLATIRYHGPGAKGLAYLQEHLPEESYAKAWSGEVTSNAVRFTVAKDLSAIKPATLVWGAVKDGLQAAVEFRPLPGSAPTSDPPGTFPTEPEVSTIFHVKNVGNRTITFVSETGRQLDEVTATDEAGQTRRLEGAWLSGWPIMVRWTLKPGEVAELTALTAGISLLKKPGKYTLRYSINFGSIVRDKGDQRFPKPDDWQQVLVTGDAPVTIRARKAESAPTAANRDQSVARSSSISVL